MIWNTFNLIIIAIMFLSIFLYLSGTQKRNKEKLKIAVIFAIICSIYEFVYGVHIIVRDHKSSTVVLLLFFNFIIWAINAILYYNNYKKIKHGSFKNYKNL